MLNGKKILAICTTKVYSPQANTLISVLDQDIRAQGYCTFVYSTSTDLYGASPAVLGEKTVYDLMDFEVIDVLLVMCEKIMNPPVIDEVIRRAREHNVPVITFGGRRDGCINLYFDYKLGMERMVRHVIDHHGCRKLHFMAGFKGNEFSEERIDVFKRVIAEYGIGFDDSMLSYGDFWSMPTIAATEKLIADNNIPEAIICANDSMAVNVCATMIKHGYRIPEDIIVTGFDGIDDTQITRPTISTCMCSDDILAHEIAKVILSDVIRNGEGSDIALSPSLDLAQSCGCVMEVNFNPAAHLAKLNDRFFRYQADESNLFQVAANIVKSRNIREIADFLDKAGFYDMTCVLRPECVDETQNPLVVPEMADDENRYLLFDTDVVRPFEPYLFSTKNEMFPGIGRLIETGDPLIFAAIHFLNVPLGYVCFHYHNYDLDNYYSMPQTVNILNNAIGCFRNMRYQHYLTERMEEIYAHDRLTGLYNRNALVNYYEENAEHMKRGSEDITFVLCDLDRLKYINDTFGHSEGDFAISSVAQALSSAVPSGAMTARWGGDEMVSLLTGSFDEAAMRESIYRFLEAAQSGKPYEITASIGVVTVKPSELVSLDEITKASDKLMYEEKQRKRKMRTT